MTQPTARRVAVIGGARTPFAKDGGQFSGYSALELATHAVDGVLDKLDLDPGIDDELAYGTVIVNPVIPHLTREVNLRGRLPVGVRSLTLTDNCITGVSAMEKIHDAIALGPADVGIAGVVESMSRVTSPERSSERPIRSEIRCTSCLISSGLGTGAGTNRRRPSPSATYRQINPAALSTTEQSAT